MSGKKAATTTVTDTGSLHPYRIELPIMIDDMRLSVSAFRLYAHFKRRAGDTGLHILPVGRAPAAVQRLVEHQVAIPQTAQLAD